MQVTIVLFLLRANMTRYFYFLVTKGNLTLFVFHKGVNSIRAEKLSATVPRVLNKKSFHFWTIFMSLQ